MVVRLGTQTPAFLVSGQTSKKGLGNITLVSRTTHFGVLYPRTDTITYHLLQIFKSQKTRLRLYYDTPYKHFSRTELIFQEESNQTVNTIHQTTANPNVKKANDAKSPIGISCSDDPLTQQAYVKCENTLLDLVDGDPEERASLTGPGNRLYENEHKAASVHG